MLESFFEGPPLIRVGEKVVSAGSCFAANLVPHLEKAGLSYLRTETGHPSFARYRNDNFGYSLFSAAYGNIYTTRQLLQLMKRALGTFKPEEDRWHLDGQVFDPFRPALRYPASSDREFDLLTAQHLQAALDAFSNADVFVFTLGLTEAWVSASDGAVFPACPGTIVGTYEEDKHVFENFGVSDVSSDLSEFIQLMRQRNPGVRVVLTVSPVPLVATATGGHVVPATTFSKSVLRVAAQEVAGKHDNVVYFPSYEIITSHTAPCSFFEADRRSVSKAGIDQVMSVFLSHCKTDPSLATGPDESTAPSIAALSAALVEAECEEAMMDRTSP